MNSFLAVLIVLGLVAAHGLLLRGSLGASPAAAAINVKAAVALGERRSLVIVSVEGAGSCWGLRRRACRSSRSFLVRHAPPGLRGGALVNSVDLQVNGVSAISAPLPIILLSP